MCLVCKRQEVTSIPLGVERARELSLDLCLGRLFGRLVLPSDLETFEGLLREIQGQNLALTVLYVPSLQKTGSDLPPPRGGARARALPQSVRQKLFGRLMLCLSSA